MSTVHRILASAFGHSRRQNPGRHQDVDLGAVTRQFVGSDVLTCTPWAGLYFEGQGA